MRPWLSEKSIFVKSTFGKVGNHSESAKLFKSAINWPMSSLRAEGQGLFQGIISMKIKQVFKFEKNRKKMKKARTISKGFEEKINSKIFKVCPDLSHFNGISLNTDS